MRRIPIIVDEDASASITTDGCEVGDLTQYSIHIWFSDASSGMLKLQASNTEDDWVDIACSVQAVSGGEAHIWNVTGASYQYVRVIWEPILGVGTISAQYVVKEQISRFF